MITKTPEGYQFSMRLDEMLVREMPDKILEIASAQLAGELVIAAGRELLAQIDPAELQRQVVRQISEKLSQKVSITVGELEDQYPLYESGPNGEAIPLKPAQTPPRGVGQRMN